MILARIHSEVLGKSWMAARFLGCAEPAEVEMDRVAELDRDRREGWGVEELVEEVVAMDALRELVLFDEFLIGFFSSPKLCIGALSSVGTEACAATAGTGVLGVGATGNSSFEVFNAQFFLKHFQITIQPPQSHLNHAFELMCGLDLFCGELLQISVHLCYVLVSSICTGFVDCLGYDVLDCWVLMGLFAACHLHS
jgi:hypothetical protein